MMENRDINKWFNNGGGFHKKEIGRILGIDYAHIKLENDDDLYITEYGLPYIENLFPENFFTDKDWFNNNSEPLNGTSCVFKIRTKKINGICKDVVLKWNRMGQNIPGAEHTDYLTHVEFNSPFEEFSLAMALIDSINKSGNRIVIQKPFAIYVPSEPMELWQTDRIEYKMQNKIKTHTEIDLDMHRSYAVIYEWIDGIDAVQAYNRKIFNDDDLVFLTGDAAEKLKSAGFVVRDNKPNHIIIDPASGNKGSLYDNGNAGYALVDFELLEMTLEKTETVKKQKRFNYLMRQRDRFNEKYNDGLFPNLTSTKLLGVDYIFGHVESTKGLLWVVGKDPYLFDYFLPERWEHTTRTKISASHEIYHTFSKDNIHLVWKASRVGLIPDMDPFKDDENKIIQYGYNSPFEEISIAMMLTGKEISTIYPRAIYMTGTETSISENLFDNRRYENHKNFLTPDGTPALKKDRNYITIWGYWNGPDEMLASRDGDFYRGMNLLNAYREGIISKEMYFTLMNRMKEKLLKIRIEDLHLRGNHLLISLDKNGRTVLDDEGLPDLRICNFEFFKIN